MTSSLDPPKFYRQGRDWPCPACEVPAKSWERVVPANRPNVMRMKYFCKGCKAVWSVEFDMEWSWKEISVERVVYTDREEASPEDALREAIEAIKDADAHGDEDCCTCDAMKVVEVLEELQVAAPKKSAWTKEQPTVPGVYWFRGQMEWLGILQDYETSVMDLDGDGDWYTIGSEARVFPALGGEWFGPLLPPECPARETEVPKKEAEPTDSYGLVASVLKTEFGDAGHGPARDTETPEEIVTVFEDGSSISRKA